MTSLYYKIKDAFEILTRRIKQYSREYRTEVGSTIDRTTGEIVCVDMERFHNFLTKGYAGKKGALEKIMDDIMWNILGERDYIEKLVQVEKPV